MSMTRQFSRALSASALALGLASASLPSVAGDVNVQSLHQQASSFFKPLPAQMPGSEADTPERIALGERLYFETALSINGTQSCNSCHRVDQKLGGVDNEPTSPGALGERGDRNSPSVWNAGFHVAQFWDGRAADLQAQAKGPILNPIEMGLASEEQALERLREAGYGDAFANAFPGQAQPLTYDNLAEAIAAFERTLITQDRFDQFLGGDLNALNQQELAGLQQFVSVGCIACHSGALLGGQMFQKMGLANAYPNEEDLGRFVVTGNPADRFVFKVPSLRNVSATAPYFHDGKAATLEDAVSQMAWYQLGRKLDEQQVGQIASFLRALENREAPALAMTR